MPKLRAVQLPVMLWLRLVRLESIFDLRLITHYNQGHLARIEITFRDPLNIASGYGVHFLYVSLQVVLRQAVQFQERKLSNDALVGRVLKNEYAAQKILDAREFLGVWRIFAQTVHLEEFFANGVARDLCGYTRRFLPARGVETGHYLAEG